MYKKIAGALTFLTKIPFPWHPDIKSEDFPEVMLFFPLVGLIIGLFLAAFGYMVNYFFDPLIGSLAVLIFVIFLTGGLHLDGIADTFDGLMSYRGKDQILEIMKDSRIGTHGVLALFCVLTIKLFFIYHIFLQGMFIGLIIFPIIGRMMLVVACYKGENARKFGMGFSFIGSIKPIIYWGAWMSTAIFFILLLVFSPFPIAIFCILGLLSALVFTLFFRFKITSYLGGITGDILGAICELSECFFLIFFVLGANLWKLYI